MEICNCKERERDVDLRFGGDWLMESVVHVFKQIRISRLGAVEASLN